MSKSYLMRRHWITVIFKLRNTVHLIINNNKTVLLRERKRHTARCVASTRCAALFGGKVPGPKSGGVPSPRSGGGTQSQVWGYPIPGPGGYPIPGPGGTPSHVRGVTPSRPGQGGTPATPYLDLGWGTPPPVWTWDGVPPALDLGWGTPPTWTWDGVPTLPRPEMGYPPDRLKI